VVKVLDFGLAKVTEKTTGTLNSEDNTLMEFETAAGLIMGTVSYMSPEQAQAKAVDGRSDIWSSGIMLYEMLSGTLPFGGSTTAHTIVEILEKHPRPLVHAGAGNVPAELERIVSKSIAKNPDERYQTAKDMLIDLRNLKKRLELDAEIEHSQAPQLKATDTGSKKQWLAITIAAAVIVAVVIGVLGFNAWRNAREPAVVVPETPVAAPVRTLTYSITVQKFKDRKPYQDPFELPGEINFEADYQIRLSVGSPQAGHLYVVNEGPAADTPEFVILFPSSTTNENSSLINENTRLQIPEESWIKFDDDQGVEKLWLVFAGQPIPELEALKKFANPRTRGLVTEPNAIQAIQKFLSDNSVPPKPEKSDTQTTLKTSQNILVYPVRLEHH
ncbi:MAG TPA: protein kinase, partial [Pyrinomonadaceae bacterium]|nr:protein kinase [Pyrinomonadaceae bacterium]